MNDEAMRICPDLVPVETTRGLVARNEWFDELHPNNEGFRKIADAFVQEIERIRNQESAEFKRVAS